MVVASEVNAMETGDGRKLVAEEMDGPANVRVRAPPCSVNASLGSVAPVTVRCDHQPAGHDWVHVQISLFA